MRLIDADLLDEVLDDKFEGCYALDVNYIQDDILPNIPTVEVPRWIPCSERLPNKKGYYLVTRKNPKGHVTRVRFNPEQVERGVYNSSWGNGDCDILAWMPLPEPWKGASDEISCR